MDTRTAQALIRFGLGRRGGEPLPSDPGAWLAAQLRGPDTARPGPSTAEALAANRSDVVNKTPPKEKLARVVFRASAQAFLDTALTTPAPFRERLVWFWANHFTVSARAAAAAPVVGPFVQDAIRPHVTGRFRDMLLAVMRHPAMLLYLDNARSMGPSSPAGQRRGRGLNENLARECMELHTVTPASGYTQADVTAFARVLTGWTAEMRQDPLGFVFRPDMHEPGAKVVMGRSFPEGEEGGLQALAFFASHPMTHRNLATKLVRHFVADDPPPEAVRRIEGVLRDTDGDLGAAAAALPTLEAAWRPLAKLRTPAEFLVAAVRATDPPAEQRQPQRLLGMLNRLGQPLWRAPLPNGWADRAADWAGPEAMLRRVDLAYVLAGQAGDAAPESLAQASLGPLLSPATLEAMRHAGARRDALTLLLASPEFQRR